MKILVSVAALLLTARGVAAAPRHVSVDGTFIDRYTGRGVACAKVELKQRHWGFPMETAPTFLAATTTDAEGRFWLLGPWRGRMIVDCSGPQGHRHGFLLIEEAASELRVLTSADVLKDNRFRVPAEGKASR